MRIAAFLAPGLLLFTSFASANDPWLPPAPANWDPKFWNATLKVARAAHDRGDLYNAERLCAIALPFLDRNIGSELDNYANLLAKEGDSRAPAARLNAQRYAKILDEHARATQPTSREMEFDVMTELNAYADSLDKQGQQKNAASIRALATAYREGQTAHVNRALMVRQKMNPRGVC